VTGKYQLPCSTWPGATGTGNARRRWLKSGLNLLPTLGVEFGRFDGVEGASTAAATPYDPKSVDRARTVQPPPGATHGANGHCAKADPASAGHSVTVGLLEPWLAAVGEPPGVVAGNNGLPLAVDQSAASTVTGTVPWTVMCGDVFVQVGVAPHRARSCRMTTV